ncbi:L-lactate dehydrogenase [Elongatibacter sediminis]
MIRPVTPADYREYARRRLPGFLFHYIDGAANEERTADRNQSDFGRWQLRQRVMRDVSGVSTAARLAGEDVALPLALAPVGLTGMFARRGEASAGRAAARVGVPMGLSTVSICSIREVQAAGPAVWFQLYMLRDRDLVLQLLEQAWESGVRTLLFTVDLAMEGVRHRDIRSGMVGSTLRARLGRAWQIVSHPRWVWDVGLRGRPHTFGNLGFFDTASNDLNAYKSFIAGQFDRAVTWEDIGWLREHWQGRLYIKGVLCEEDARAAAERGADGVVVSNHGGRQLDEVSSTIGKLPEVVAAVGDQLEVLLDGGVRSGLDIVRAVALGARGVLIGRPFVYALAARGEAGVHDLLATLQHEMTVAMALMGVTQVNELNPDCLQYCGPERV